MAGWIKMPLGMEVGLSPGDFVFDGDPPTGLNFSGNARELSSLTFLTAGTQFPLK